MVATYVWYLIEEYGLDNFKRVYMGLEQVEKYLYPQFEEDAVTIFIKNKL